MNNQPTDYRGSVELAVASNGVVYIVGWATFGDRGGPVRLFMKPVGGNEVEVDVTPQFRGDINRLLKLPDTCVAGYTTQLMLSEYSMDELPPGDAEIIVGAPDGTYKVATNVTVELQWPTAIEKVQENRSNAPHAIFPAKVSMLQKIWGGTLGGVPQMGQILYPGELDTDSIIKAGLILEERPKSGSYVRDSVTINLARLLHAASRAKGLNYIFDHGFGGGANIFSNKLINAYASAGNAVVRFWFDPRQAAFMANVISGSTNTPIAVGGVNDLFAFCTHFRAVAIQLNTLWGYPHLAEVVDNLLRLKLYGYAERLEFFAHDHMPICPSLFLLNADHNFCGVPKDLEVCGHCLRDNNQEFKVFFRERDISAWRRMWERVLRNCDLIRFFSKSTYQYYIKAIPWLDESNTVVIGGHEVKHIWDEEVTRGRSIGPHFNIGVFGYIGPHKGSDIIKDLARSMESAEDESRILVFGSLDGVESGQFGSIRIMGTFDRGKLVALWEEHALDFAFVPSICPETFSFITRELMAIGAPIMAFNLGAQAEFLADYEWGHLLQLPHEAPVYEGVRRVLEQHALTAWERASVKEA